MTTITRTDPTRDGDPRIYTIDGRRYPSVTSIINIIGKPGLVPWATKVALAAIEAELRNFVDDPLFGGARELTVADIRRIVAAAGKIPNETRDTAADFGTRAHAIIEGYLRFGSLPDVHYQELRPAFDNFLSWYRTAGFSVMGSEQVVHSPTLGFAGTFDFLGAIGNELTICDFKTSNALYKEYDLQVAGYVIAYNEMNSIPVTQALLLRVNKETPKKPGDEFEAVLINGARLEEAKVGFEAALKLWKWQHGV